MNESVALPPAVTPSRIDFSDRRSDFRRLVMRGAMLELVTVAFYRFWLATDVRRHLWSHTSVDGDALEYTGTAKELLLGFLFALAILVPIYLIYFLIGLEAERWQAFASTPLGIFFYLFAQFAIYRARRYRLTRTIWRGVRFWMAGSGWSYAWRAGLWTVFTFLTFGLALPWRQAALERFKMRHTSYGNLPGRFVGKGFDFFKRGWALWLMLWLMLVLPILVWLITHLQVLVVFSIIGELIALPFIYAKYKAVEWQWWVSGIRFGSVYFESNMPRGELIGIYWTVVGWYVVLFIFLAVWLSGVVGFAFAVSNMSGTTAEKTATIMQGYSVLAAMGFGYVVCILALWMIMRIYLIHDIWQRVAVSATVHDLGAASDVAAQGELVGALGEGFADSLDVVGF